MRSLIVAATLFTVSFSGCQKQSAKHAQASRSVEMAIYKKVAENSWWSAPRTADDIIAIAEKISKCNAKTVVWIDSSGNFRSAPVATYQGIPQGEWKFHSPDGIDKANHIHFVANDGFIWSRDEAALGMLTEIQKAEYIKRGG